MQHYQPCRSSGKEISVDGGSSGAAARRWAANTRAVSRWQLAYEAGHRVVSSQVWSDSRKNTKRSYRRGTARRTVTVKTVLNVAQVFVELHLISPALGEWPSGSSKVIGNGTNRYFLLVVGRLTLKSLWRCDAIAKEKTNQYQTKRNNAWWSTENVYLAGKLPHFIFLRSYGPRKHYVFCLFVCVFVPAAPGHILQPGCCRCVVLIKTWAACCKRLL